MRIHRIHHFDSYSYVLETPDALFLVDAGMVGNGRAVLRTIERIGRRPEELRLIIVTHGHADHFGGVADVQDVARVPVIVHPAHADVVSAGEAIVSPGLNPIFRAYEKFARRYLPHAGLRGVHDVLAVADGTRLDSWDLPGRILYTPGHSAGDITLLLDDGSAFVGDTIHGRRVPGFSPPELPKMALDIDAVFASWDAILAAGATTIYPAHGSVFSAERVVPVLAHARARRKRIEAA